MRDNTSRPSWLLVGGIMTIALTALGCDKSAPPAPAPTSSAEAIPASGPIEKLNAPAKVVAFGGISKPNAWLQELGALLKKGKIDFDARIVQATLKQELGLRSAAAIDLAKPLRFVSVATSGTAVDTAILLGIRGEKELLADLPENKRFDHETGVWSFGSGNTHHLMIWGKVVAVARRGGILEEHRDFLRMVYGADTGSQLRIKIQTGEHLVRYAKALLALSGRRKPTLKQGIGPAARAAAQLADIVLDVEARATGLSIQAKTQAQAKSKLSKTLAELTKHELRLLGRIPENASAGVALYLPPSIRTEWTDALSHLGAPPSSDTETKSKVKKALREFWSASSGELAIMLEPRSGEHSAGVVGLIGTRDQATTKKAVKALLKLGQKHTGIGHRLNAYRVGQHAVHQVRLGDTKTKQTPLSPWAPILNYDMAITKDEVIMLYGDGADAAMTTWLAGSPKVNKMMSKRTASLGAAAKSPFFVAFLSPVPALASIRWSRLKPLSQAASALKPSKAFAVFAAGVHDGQLSLGLSLPAALLTDMAALTATPR